MNDELRETLADPPQVFDCIPKLTREAFPLAQLMLSSFGEPTLYS